MLAATQHVRRSQEHAPGSRAGTVDCSKEQFAAVFGPPSWEDADPENKVTIQWQFATPRGPAEVRDYWWNAANELSIGAPNCRAARWIAAFCRAHGIPATTRRHHARGLYHVGCCNRDWKEA